jgi:hypothetical protein
MFQPPPPPPPHSSSSSSSFVGTTVHDETWSLTTARHWYRSCDFRLQFLRPIVFKSSTESSHLIACLPTRRVPLVYVELTSCKGSAPAF